MNKKSLFGLFAMGTMLFTASCQEEDIVKQAQENTLATVSINVTTPEMGVATRAFGDGTTAMDLHYAVYNVKTVDGVEELTYLPELTEEDHEINISTTVDLQLVTGNTYKVIFWADNENAPYTTNWENVENPTVTIDYSEVTSNNENYDAFFNWMTINVDAAKTVGIELYRPFAQLNIGTSDIIKASQAGYTLKQTQVKVEGFQTLNLWDKTVADPTEVLIDFRAADYPNYDAEAEYGLMDSETEGYEKFPVGGYEYMAMNYLLRPLDKELVDVEFYFYSDEGEKKERKYASVPLQRNWRTNVYGQLITSDVDVNVEIIPYFDGEHNIQVWDGHTLAKPARNDNEVLVYNAAELAYIANAINGGGQSNAVNNGTGNPEEADGYDYTDGNCVIKLMNNIDLGGESWTPIKELYGTFDGNGFTISNLYVRTEGRASAGLFAAARNVKNLTVKDADIQGQYKAGAIVGDGLCARIENCHVENAKILVTPFEKDDANNVGGIVGYISAEPTSYVKDCSVKNAEITAYRKVGGIVGYANRASVVSGNTVENVSITADQTPEYKEEKPFEAGEIVGGAHADAVIENNTVGANVNLKKIYFGGAVWYNGVYEVENWEQLTKILGLDLTGDVTIAFTGDIEGNVVVEQQAGLNYTIDGRQHKYDGTIELYGHSRFEDEETLLIKNINFEHANGAIDFISCNTTESVKRYAHNVTVENCTFTGNSNGDVVGMRYRQCYNMIVKNSTATSMHSLMWATGGNGVTIDGVTMTNSKNGVSFGTTTNAIVKNSNITADGEYAYGIRVDASVNSTMSVDGCEISADCPILLRKATGTYTLALTGENKLETSKAYHIISTNDDYVAESELTYATGKITITGADRFNVYSPEGIFRSSVANENISEITLTRSLDFGTGVVEINTPNLLLNMEGLEVKAGGQGTNNYAFNVRGAEVEVNDANMNGAGFAVMEGSNVTVNSGKIEAKPGKSGRNMFYVTNNSSVTVNEGTYTFDRTSCYFVYVDEGSTCYINGGHFEKPLANSASKDSFVNSASKGQVIITGGTFNVDPSRWVAEGYVAEKSRKFWTVSKSF